MSNNVVTNLKVRFGADTSGMKKGIDEGKKSVEEFTKVGIEQFDKFASVFGVNISGISQQAGAFSKSLTTMAGGLKSSTAASGGLSAAMKILKVALISTGIGALVVALGSLIAYFTKTKEGADMVSKAMAAIGAVVSVITDRLSDLGEVFVNAFKNPKKTISDLWEFLKSQFLNRIAAIPQLIQSAWNIVKGIFTGGAGDAAKEFAKNYTQLLTGLDEEGQKKVLKYVKGVKDEMVNEAKAAMELETRLKALERAEIALIENQSKRNLEIAKSRLVAKDETKSIEERLNAAKRALELERQDLDERKRIAVERASIIAAQKDLGKNLDADDRELAEARAEVNRLEEESIMFQRKLQTEVQGLTKEYEKQLDALKALNAEKSKFIQPLDSKAFVNSAVDIPQKLEPVKTEIQDFSDSFKNVTIDLQEVATSGLTELTTSFAQGFGELLAGAGNAETFGNIIISALADMAITVGKIAVSTGIALAGIKKALASLNPAVAIAAGVALIALGYAAKASLKSVANSGSGNFSSAGGSGSGLIDTRGSSGNLQAQPVQVHITGQLTGKGKDLVAVIDQTNYVNGITR